MCVWTRCECVGTVSFPDATHSDHTDPLEGGESSLLLEQDRTLTHSFIENVQASVENSSAKLISWISFGEAAL